MNRDSINQLDLKLTYQGTEINRLYVQSISFIYNSKQKIKYF